MWNEILPEIRWVKKELPVEGSELFIEAHYILQQKKRDGYGNVYWQDVPIVEENGNSSEIPNN